VKTLHDINSKLARRLARKLRRCADKLDPPSTFRPPELDEVEEYCREQKSNIDGREFVDFYESKGWKVGNQNMKDWQASLRNWMRKDQQNGHGNGQGTRSIALLFVTTF